jgi:sulfur transfer complex TusBCD TusB component (DsrH family)
MPTGMEIRLLIEDNIVFGTIGSLPIALLTRNEDVIVRNNKTDKPIKIEYPDGAISENNTLIEPAQ